MSAPHLNKLTERRAEFLRFLERRVGNSATAEDLLQASLVRSLSRIEDVRDDAALVGWFYKVLENAVIDHFRRQATAARAMERAGEELTDIVETEDAPSRTCRCVAKLKAELKPEFAEALEKIEVDGVAVKDFAEQAGLSRSNAGVRIFRARAALREKVEKTCGHCAKAGCRDCSCVR